MCQRPWMALYIADYLADTAHLNTTEHGAYLLLIMHYWRNSSLPADDGRLARIVHLTPKGWKKVRPTLRAFFMDDQWRHKRIEAELAQTASQSRAGRTAGQASAMRRRSSQNHFRAPKSGSQNIVHDRPKIAMKNGKSNEINDDFQRPVNDRSTICQPSHSHSQLQSERASTSSEKNNLGISGAGAPPATSGILQKAAPYAFEGMVVKLRQDTYDRWRRTYPRIANFDAELQRIDDWYATHPDKRDHWFYGTSNWLKKSNDEADVRRKDELRRRGSAW